MIPRVAQSGQSFRGAGLYYLNDKRDCEKSDLAGPEDTPFDRVGDYTLSDKGDRRTAERVGFTHIMNMEGEADTPEQAISRMSASFERYREREANKRGRKLKKPVYAYSLAWAPDQNPTQKDMLDAVHSSLKALGAEGLQTLVVQHVDEPHPHVHVIVNRIERDGSRARNIAFDTLKLSRWAEEYERTHGGIRCEQRVENNARRGKGEYVKDQRSISRDAYETIQREQLKAELDCRFQSTMLTPAQQARLLRPDFSEMTQRHSEELYQLSLKREKQIVHNMREAKGSADKLWQNMYQEQDRVGAELFDANRGGILERAVFVFRHRYLLATAGRMGIKDIAKMCLSGEALRKRVEAAHRRERSQLADFEKSMIEKTVAMAWRDYKQDRALMDKKHQAEQDFLHYRADINEGVWREPVFTPPEKRNDHVPLRRIEKPEQAPTPTPAPAPKTIQSTKPTPTQAQSQKQQPEPTPTRAAPKLEPGAALDVGDAAKLVFAAKRAPPSKPPLEPAREPPEDPALQLRQRLKDFRKRYPGRDFGREL